jgi:uncharacterized membrane protein
VNPLHLRWMWEAVRTSYWFAPAVMTLGALGLALGLGALDEALQARDKYTAAAWLWTGGPEGARMLLGTAAGALITVASTIFSITIVALTLASNTFGPRLLRNFMRDRGNQLVLGAFTATFVYCLLVLRSVRGGEDAAFVPHVSITVALALVLVNVGVLIFFIHHVAISIQADQVIAVASRDLEHAIARFLARAGAPGEHEPEARDELDVHGAGHPMIARHGGYLQAIDEDRLLAALTRRQAVARLAYRPGQFIVEGAEIARIWLPGAGDGLDAKCIDELRETFLIEDRRTPMQDLEFSIHQLVEIAARALSPGINDPFTAATCIDWLGEALCKLTVRPLPDGRRSDERGTLRIVGSPFTFDGVIDAAFDPMRQHAANSPYVLIRLMDSLLTLASRVQTPAARATVLRHARKVERAGRAWPEAEDHAELVSRLHRLSAILHDPGREPPRDLSAA